MSPFLRIILPLFMLLLFPRLCFSMAMESYEIHLVEAGVKTARTFVKAGNIRPEFREPLTSVTGLSNSIEKWEAFKLALATSQQKAIAAAVAGNFRLEQTEFKRAGDYHEARLRRLNGDLGNDFMKTNSSCLETKGPDNGIDGVYILDTETIEAPTHILINEAKFRENGPLTSADFGFIQGKLGENQVAIQQCHSYWLRKRFSEIECLSHLNYDDCTIIRTATLLDGDGAIWLYKIFDREE